MVAALLLSMGSAAATGEENDVPSKPLGAGDPAPDFTLPDQNREPVTLSDYRGESNVVLAFYILAFTGG